MAVYVRTDPRALNYTFYCAFRVIEQFVRLFVGLLESRGGSKCASASDISGSVNSNGNINSNAAFKKQRQCAITSTIRSRSLSFPLFPGLTLGPSHKFTLIILTVQLKTHNQIGVPARALFLCKPLFVSIAVRTGKARAPACSCVF